MNDKEKDTVTKEERSLLETLDKIVRSEKVRAQILPIVERVRTELARKPNTVMAWEPIALETFGDLPSAIRSGWLFILRAGSDTGAERHPNSHQRMMTFGGTGDMQTDIKSVKNEVESQSEIEWQSNVLVSDADAPLEARWISIPQNIWHRPVIPKAADWVLVSFHTVPATELIEERPGAKQMRYLGTESKGR
ncbi:MAG TPA: hypothetical protein VEP30_07510 [Chthoniobacterales bacterium]|nr:hypothetical protein [Chthoniobacterales bacterium]